MYIEHLTTFLNLAETLNFSQTAIKMNLSQSAVSQAINSIERQLGITLFFRSKKGVALTPAGLDFYESLKPWMNGYFKAVQHAQQIENRRKTNLTIGYSGTPFELATIPQIIKAFTATNPSIKIFLENFPHHRLLDELEHGLCDVIFTMPDIINGHPNFAFQELLTGYYCVIIPEKYSFPKVSKVQLSDLDSQRLIYLDNQWCPPSQDALQKLISKSSHNLDLTFVNNIETAHAMVKSGLGLGVWANFVSDPRDQELKALPIVSPITPVYGVSYLKGKQSHAAQVFVSWLKNYDF